MKTGSADELANEAGLSHFIEHLVFKGTPSFKPGEIAGAVESHGGELNAYTSFDQTVFYMTLPKQHLGVASQALSEMVTAPIFDPTEVDREREVVIEEIKRGFDSPGRVASQFLFEEMFTGHPYAMPIIGTEENIRRVSVDEIKSYFDERYVADNMAIVCVGDLDFKETIAVLEKDFTKIPTSPQAKQNRERSSRSLSNSRFSFKESNFEKTFFYLSWPIEGCKDEDAESLEVLALMMGQGESSHLYKDLKLQNNLCESIGCFSYSSRENGIFSVSGVTSDDKLDALLNSLSRSIESFLTRDSIEVDLEKAKNIFESEDSYSRESLSSLCRQIGDDWLYYDNVEDHKRRKDKISKITVSELVEAAKRLFLKDSKLCIVKKGAVQQDISHAFTSEIEKIKDIKIAWVEDQKRELKSNSSKSDSSKAQVTQFDTPNGNKVVFIPDDNTDVVAARIATLGGEILSSSSTQGLVSLFGNLWGRESKIYSEEKQNQLLDFYCSSFGSFSGRHSSGLTLTTLRKSFEELSDLFVHALNEYKFSPDILEREKENIKFQINSRRDYPTSILFREFEKALFPKAIYSRDSLAEIDHLASISSESLKSFYENHQDGCVISLVGNLGETDLKKFIDKIDDALGPRKFNLSLDERIPGIEENYFSEMSSDKAQSHIVLGYRSIDFKDERKDLVGLINAILGGQSGRLFIELRDKASLAYSVAPVSYSGVFGGYFGTYIGCDPSKREIAIKMMKEELTKLASDLVTGDEFEAAKSQLLGKQARSFQRNSSLSETILFDTLYGMDSFHYNRLSERLNNFKREDIRDFISSLLEQNEVLITLG